MQLARDAAAFLILELEQSAGKVPHCIFGNLVVGDLGQRADEALCRAVRIGQSRCADPEPTPASVLRAQAQIELWQRRIAFGVQGQFRRERSVQEAPGRDEISG